MIQRLLPVVYATIGSLLGAVSNFCFGDWAATPNPGLLFGLSITEWLVLLWMPIAPLLLQKEHIPNRWWGIFGIISFLLLYPSFKEFIMHGPGRRPWVVQDEDFSRFLFFVIYFVVVPSFFASWKQCTLRLRSVA